MLHILEEDGVSGESGVSGVSGVSGEAQEEGVVVAPLPLRALSKRVRRFGVVLEDVLSPPLLLLDRCFFLDVVNSCESF